MEFLRRKFLMWGTALFLLFVILSAARIGAADLLSNYARDEMFAWSGLKMPPETTSMDNVSNILDWVSMISPGDPGHYEDLSRLALIRSGIPGVTEAQKNAHLEESLVRIRQAIALRPVSSYSWSTLLMIKRERMEYDSEFRHALERATTMGPWEPQVQLIVADVGLTAWAALPYAEREMVRLNFVRGMIHQSNAMIAIAQSHQNDCNGTRAKFNAGCPR